MKKPKAPPPLLKPGQVIFFESTEKGGSRLEWQIGEIAHIFPESKKGEERKCKVVPYEIPARLLESATAEEWSSEAPPVISFHSDRIMRALVILARLESRTKFPWKKGKAIEIEESRVRPLTRDAYMAAVLKSETGQS